VAGVIVLDANILIAHLDANDVHHSRARALLSDLPGDLAVSTLTLAEVLVRPALLGRAELVVKTVHRLGIDELALPPAIQLADIRATTGLRMPDSCVLATAIAHGADVATFDAVLATKAEPLGVVCHSG
jgi:predicted nucleic acid-binding protein